MTRPTRVAAFYLAVVFVAGGLFGFVAHGLYTQKAARAEARPNPREFRERYIAKLRSDLSLEPGQVSEITAILEETNSRFREIRERMNPEFEAIRTQQRQKIMALLNPEQRVKYEKLLEQWQRERQQRKSGR